MCGICGFIQPGLNRDTIVQRLSRMSAPLAHRGPDDEGIWAHPDGGLAARRLSIIDLSPAGHQPMLSNDGQLTLVFNGEIYNHASIRASLEAKGHAFRGHSDTECILHAYAAYGDEMLTQLHGMFALALWDAGRRRLFLARDPLGKKPLYYFADANCFAFSSEIKSLLEFPALSRTLDWQSVGGFFTRRYIAGPSTVFRDIKKLQPGHCLIVEQHKPPEERCYWSPPKPRANQPPPDSDELDQLLQDSVRLRLVADVPVGAFLSGGVDSSLIVALMARFCPNPIKTFSVGFESVSGFDESAHADHVSKLFGTQHVSVRVTARDVVSALPDAVYYLDEPLADPAALPTLLLSRVAARELKVTLTGEGADELFGGYTRYRYEQRISRLQRSHLFPLIQPLFAMGGKCAPSRRMRKALQLLQQSPEQRFTAYHRVFSPREQALLFPRLADQAAIPISGPAPNQFPSTTDWLMWHEILTWLPDDLLMKVDKMCMAASLEARAPYLDRTLVERLTSVPAELKIDRSGDKVLLRNVARRYLPAEIVDRPKHGFDVPIDHWLRADLKSFAGEILLGATDGPTSPNPEVIRSLWEGHQSGRFNHGLKLWTLLSWNLWCARYQPLP